MFCPKNICGLVIDSIELVQNTEYNIDQSKWYFSYFTKDKALCQQILVTCQNNLRRIHSCIILEHLKINVCVYFPLFFDLFIKIVLSTCLPYNWCFKKIFF